MSDRDPWTDLVHRLDTVPDPAPGLPPAADLRRRGERRHRTRVAVAAAVGGAGVAGALALTGVLGGGGLRTTPVPPATSSSSPTVVPSLVPTPSGPSGRSSPAASPGAASDLSGLLLRPRDLAGVGAAGRAWRQERTARLSVGCDPAAPVAGDATLLRDARQYLDDILADHDAFLARFARAADQFGEGGNWWARLTSRRDDQSLDLKKLGTFPIVHGVRALALQYRVRALGTEPRLRALVQSQRIDDALARDLLDALRFVMALKLTHQLRQRERGEAPSNLVQPSALGTLERDQLTDSLAIIKRFRAFLRQHFKLDAL